MCHDNTACLTVVGTFLKFHVPITYIDEDQHNANVIQLFLGLSRTYQVNCSKRL